MRKLLFFLSVFVLIACTKNKSDDGMVSNYFIKNIHWGSKENPLKGVTISWCSNSLGSKIKWGYTTNYESGIFDVIRNLNYKNYLYEYTFPYLKPASILYYSIYDSLNRKWSYSNTFKTASDSLSTNFSFTFAGDTRTRVNIWNKVSNVIENTDFSLFLGDLVEDGSNDSLWENWYDYGKIFLSKNLIFHSIGNHDYPNDIYLNQFVLPGNELYYSFNYGNALFICLNSENPADLTQYTWLLNTLEINKTKTWKFVFFHRPFFTNGGHQGEMNAYFDTWWKTFDDYGVDMIFNGHTHNYQRTIPINRFSTQTSPPIPYGDKPEDGRCQVISGGAGAPLVTASSEWFTKISYEIDEFCRIYIKERKLTLVAKNSNGIVIDYLIIQK